MANKYWAAGVSGNWNSITSWSDFAIGTPAGAVVPGAGDAAIFNAASGTVTATLDISPTIQTLTCTGFTGTLAFGTNTISLNSTGTVFTGATTMTVTGTPQIICTNNSATARTITPTAVTEANSISFRITAGTGTLGLTAGSYRNLDFTDGTNPTGYGGALTGSTSITIYGDLKASTNMTVGAGGGVFTFAATSGTKTINTAGVTFDKPFTFNGVGGTWQLQSALTSGASRACTLTAGTLDLNNYTLTTGLFSTNNANTRVIAFGTGNITITGVSGTVFAGPTSANTGLTTTGTAQVNVTGNGITTRTVNPGDAAAITGFISFTISNGSDTINSSAGMTFNNLTFTSGFTGTFGNVSRSIFGNLTLDPAITSFSSGASTLTFTGTGVQTITTANETIDCPITFDGIGGTWALQDALTSGATRTCTLTNGTLNLNDYTLTTGIFSSDNSNTRVLAFGSSGNISLTSASTTADVTIFNASTSTNFTVTGTDPYIDVDGAPTSFVRSITPGTTSLGGSASNAISFYINAGSDTISFGTANRVVNDLVFRTNVTLAADAALQIYGSYSNGNYATITGGTNAWTFRATSLKAVVSVAGTPINNPVIFDGIGGIWQIVSSSVINGAVTLTNGTLEIQDSGVFTVGSFATSGTNQKYLGSTSPGSQATISAASGTNTVSYLTIQDSYATGGATWNAFYDYGNINAGNNTGWYFGDSPTVGNEITMRLRSFTQPRRF